MSKLTIFWCEKNAKCFYWTADGAVPENNHSPIHQLDSHEILKADLACLADLAVNKKVELIVSNTDVHFGQVNLPNKAQRHIRKAVPYLLEEQLADAVDKTFVAIGERLKSGEIPVRAIKQNYLHELMTEFQQAEIKLDRIRVDLDLLETPELGFELVLMQDQVLISEDNGHRWSCHKDDFSWLVQKRLSNINHEDGLPIAIPVKVVCDKLEDYSEFERNLPVGAFSAQSQMVDSVFDYLAQSKQVMLNILQAEYETKEKNSPLKMMMLKVASIVAVVLFAHVIYQASLIVSLNNQKDLLANERSALWKQAFPGRKEPSNIDSVLRTTLAGLKGGDGDASFLMMLESTSAMIKDLQKIYPTNITYDAARNELRMDLVAEDLPILNQYRDDLKQTGHEVEMSSATQRGEGYSSRLIIRKL